MKMKGTYDHQNSLGLLPVPKLETTLEKYLASVECLLDGDEFQETQRLVRDFAKETGPKLQELLVQHARFVEEQRIALPDPSVKRIDLPPERHPDGSAYPDCSWLERYWESLAYLSDRTSIAVNVNCFHTHFGGRPCHDSVKRGAWAMAALVDAKRLLDDSLVPPERAGKGLACSAQYYRVFSTNRMPHLEQDFLCTYKESRHVAVERRGHWYVIPNVDDLSVSAMEKQLAAIKQDAAQRPIGPGIAAFTAQNRTSWANARTHVESLSVMNEKALYLIESSMFHIVLSEAKPANVEQALQVAQHGNGEQIWYDHCQTYILCDNGVFVQNLEHAAADAVVMGRIYRYMCEFVHINGPEGIGYDVDLPFKEGASNIPVTKHDGTGRDYDGSFQRVDFLLDRAGEELLQEAKMESLSLIEDNVVTGIEFKDFGSKMMKKMGHGISPDSFCQMALALAFYRDQNVLPVTYETASTRGFFHGRTETIRPQSNFMKRFIHGMDDKSVPRDQVRNDLINAANHHKDYLKDCMLGNGIDRHLLVLRVLSAEHGIPLHPIFQDKAYTLSTKFTLSTSTMPWQTPDWVGFGAYELTAYGTCYRPIDNRILIVITSRAKNNVAAKNKDPHRFAERIQHALCDVMALLSTNSKL